MYLHPMYVSTISTFFSIIYKALIKQKITQWKVLIVDPRLSSSALKLDGIEITRSSSSSSSICTVVAVLASIIRKVCGTDSNRLISRIWRLVVSLA